MTPERANLLLRPILEEFISFMEKGSTAYEALDETVMLFTDRYKPFMSEQEILIMLYSFKTYMSICYQMFLASSNPDEDNIFEKAYQAFVRLHSA